MSDTFVTNYLFDGAQANIVKELSPSFHVQHQFSLGSQVMPPMYNFMSGYVTEKVKRKCLSSWTCFVFLMWWLYIDHGTRYDG